MKRIILLLLALLLLLPTFSACSSSEEAVFTYDGHTITASQYRYWVANYKTEILKYHGVTDSEAFWKTEITDGVTMEEYYTPIIDGVVQNYCIAQALYRRYGLAISADVKKAINDDINEKIELYGSRAEVNAALAPIGINISQLKEIYTIQEKYQAVHTYLFGANGTMAATADEVKEYYNTNYFRMKYIVFETTEPVLDKNGNPTFDATGAPITVPCTKEELTRKRTLMETIKDRAGLGTEDTFDELIEEYSAYELDDFPNGIYISANEADVYGSDIIQALADLNPGQCAIVEQTGYLFLIRKYELTPFDQLQEDDITAQLSDLEYYTAQQLSASMYADLHKDITVNSTRKAELTLTKVTANADRNF